MLLNVLHEFSRLRSKLAMRTDPGSELVEKELNHVSHRTIEIRVRNKLTGMGTQAKAKKAGIDDAQWIPRFRYMYVVNKGKMVPNSDRSTLLAAKLDAA